MMDAQREQPQQWPEGAQEDVGPDMASPPISTRDMAGERPVTAAPAEGTNHSAEPDGDAFLPLLEAPDASGFQSRWQRIQQTFVDEPKAAVKDADGLVAEVMQAVARAFADEREQLEQRWTQGEDVSTEDLRQILQRYRSFFQRLLAA
jgi:hypothetical protein